MSNYYTDTHAPESDLFAQERRIPVFGGFWERFLAAFIDGIVLSVINELLKYSIGDIEGSVGSLVIDCLYFALLESSSKQATLGKMALGLQVTNLEGGRISFLQGVGRYFGRILSAIILFIGYLMMLWDENKQTLHDKMAGTLVVKAVKFQEVI
jgi:uncharacterized RDD family membrane protein YckC